MAVQNPGGAIPIQQEIQQEGQFIVVNKQRYRVNVTDKELTKDQRVKLAEQVLSSLKATVVDYQNLDNTTVTPHGVTTDQHVLSTFNHANPKIANIAGRAMPAGNAQSPVFGPLWARVTFSNEEPKIAKFVQFRLKMPGIIAKMRNVCLRVFFPKTYENEKEYLKVARVDAAAKLVGASQTRMGQTADIVNNFVHVPKKMIMKADEKIDTPFDSEKTVAQVAVGKKGQLNKQEENLLYRPVDEIDSRGIKVNGYRAEDMGNNVKALREGQVIPSAFKLGKKNADHLTDCYISVHDEHRCMRHGPIDTKEKAKEFLLAAGRGPNNRQQELRIASHQLDAPANESKMIKKQNHYLAAAERKDRRVQIAQMSSPLSSSGESKTKSTNVEGLVLYLKWTSDELEEKLNDPTVNLTNDQRTNMQKGLRDLKGDKVLDEMVDKRNTISNNLGKIVTNNEAIEQAKKNIEDLQEQIRNLQEQVSIPRRILKTLKSKIPFVNVPDHYLESIKDFEDQIALQKVDIAKKEAEKISFGAEIAKLRTELNPPKHAWGKAHNNLRAKYADLKKLEETLQTRLATPLDQKRAAVTTEINKNRTMILNNTKEIKRLEQQVKNLQALKREYDNALSRGVVLERKKGSYERFSAKKVVEITQQEQEIARLQSEIDDCERNLRNIEADHAFPAESLSAKK